MANHSGSDEAPPQWYSDPAGTGRLRWWNGHAWTEHYLDAPDPSGQAHQFAPGHQHPWAQQYGQPYPSAQQGYAGQTPYPQGYPGQQGQTQYAQGPLPYPQGYGAHPYYGQTPYGSQPGYPQQYPAYGAAPYFAPAAPVRQPLVRPKLSAETAVYNPMIWLIVLLPVVFILFELFWNPSVTFIYTRVDGQETPILDADATYAVLGALILASWALYAGTVVLAYFDWRWLQKAGVVKPFHWGWSFIGGVYAVGRSVIVRRVAGPRGFTTFWVWLAVLVVGLIVYIVKVVEVVNAILNALPPNA